MSQEFSDPHLLPESREKSADELAIENIARLPQLLDSFSVLDLNEASPEGLDTLKEGIYRLQERPSTNLLKLLPAYHDGQSEVGIACIRGTWLINLGTSERLATTWPDEFKTFEESGMFQFDGHSHPGDDEASQQPSNQDVRYLDSTVDGHQYIFTTQGILEYRRPDEMPGGRTSHHQSGGGWADWITQDLKLSEEEFHQQGAWQLKRQFYETFFGLRNIPWENEDEISQILQDKENLE